MVTLGQIDIAIMSNDLLEERNVLLGKTSAYSGRKRKKAEERM
jgi:hypothetical protein